MTTMAMTKNHVMNANTEKAMGSTKMSLMDRFHKYMDDNAFYLACAAAAQCNSGYVAARIMQDATEYQRAHNA